MKSKDLNQAELQRELDLFRQPEPNAVPIEIIRKKATSGAAFTLACDSSGLADQTIYEFVGIDAGTFSKIKKGLATLQADDIQKFCYAVNNRIYPEWQAYQVGCTLIEIESETQRQLRSVQDQLDRERAERLAVEETMRRILTGAKA